jgi:hypothetical protein
MHVLSETLRLSSFIQWFPREANNDIDINGAFFFCHLTLLVWSEWCPNLKKTLWVIRKKKPFFRWLTCVTFPLLINICSDYLTFFFFVYKEYFNICEVDVSSLGFKVSFRLGGYIFWFYFTLILIFCVIMILQKPIKPLSFVAFGVGPWLWLGMNLAKLEISLFVHFMVTKYK